MGAFPRLLRSAWGCLLAAVLTAGQGCVYLKVTTEPSGADVRVNGRVVGQAPVETPLSAFGLATPTDIEVDAPGYFPGSDRVGWWASWFWIWGTTKTRHIALWREMPCPTCSEPTTVDMRQCPRCGQAFE